MLALVTEGTAVAGTFTSSLCPSAPVDWCRKMLPGGRGRAIVVNSGNANAFTGRHGETAAELTATTIASALSIPPEEVFLASTGVIGENLPTDALTDALPQLAKMLLPAGPETWESAANAIRTTDTFAKGAGASLAVGGVPVHVAGIAKGSGMIAPDMATMLGFVFTDARVSPSALQTLLGSSVEASYNRITVDSDTSTSDTVLLFATGAAGNDEITGPDDPGYAELAAAVRAINLDLAHQIVRDGEGATKFVEVTVTSADSDDAAKVIALSIANSPLVKTALAAEDANWGRIVMAVGKAGQRADRDALAVWIGDELVADKGVQHAEYSEARATDHLRNDEVRIRADVGIGAGKATVWTCDLTHGYIDINAGYRS
jgi:glutamate N-acetyltransferase/amino-acid N-acetyltransferase